MVFHFRCANSDVSTWKAYCHGTWCLRRYRRVACSTAWPIAFFSRYACTFFLLSKRVLWLPPTALDSFSRQRGPCVLLLVTNIFFAHVQRVPLAVENNSSALRIIFFNQGSGRVRGDEFTGWIRLHAQRQYECAVLYWGYRRSPQTTSTASTRTRRRSASNGTWRLEHGASHWRNGLSQCVASRVGIQECMQTPWIRIASANCGTGPRTRARPLDTRVTAGKVLVAVHMDELWLYKRSAPNVQTVYSQ